MTNPTAGISNTLHAATHVFIRHHDAICKPLQPPYHGPYKVLDRPTHHFTVDVNGRRDTVAISRLKPAYLEGVTLLDSSSIHPQDSTQIQMHISPFSSSRDTLWAACPLACSFGGLFRFVTLVGRGSCGGSLNSP